MVTIYTIGFTKKPAKHFFGLLREAGVARLVDVRLNNVSQLAGFTKRDDLAFFLREICKAEYYHELSLAPESEMLSRYMKSKKTQDDWDRYEDQFISLLSTRKIEESIPREFLNNSVLLCSEAEAHHCHRRLVVEYLADHWQGLTITHL